MRRKYLLRRLVHRWGARATHAVIMRIASTMLPQCATYFSDSPIRNPRSWPSPRPRRAVLAILKTRNRLRFKPPTWHLIPRSYWIPGASAPTLSEKCNAFLRPLKNEGFKEERGTTRRLDELDTSTTLESNKSLVITRLDRLARS